MPTLLIFGASRGLGRALAQSYLERGWNVIATVRSAGALDELMQGAQGKLEVETLDTTDRAALDGLHERMAGRTLDLLFVNAGISGPDGPIGEVDTAAFGNLMEVNSLAPLHIVESFRDLVAVGGTIAVMSSILGSVAGNSTGGYDAYRMSKAALNMGLRSTFVADSGTKRTYLALHPGWVKTDMGGPEALLTIDESIAGLIDVIAARQGTGGCAYVAYDGAELPW